MNWHSTNWNGIETFVNRCVEQNWCLNTIALHYGMFSQMSIGFSKLTFLDFSFGFDGVIGRLTCRCINTPSPSTLQLDIFLTYWDYNSIEENKPRSNKHSQVYNTSAVNKIIPVINKSAILQYAVFIRNWKLVYIAILFSH